MTPEQAAELILNAAGSSLRHYTPMTKQAILAAVKKVMDDQFNEGRSYLIEE